MKEHLKNKLFYYLGGFIILFLIFFEARGKGDFNIFISASRDLMQGKNIYQLQYNDYYHYYYNILFALILTPFTYLPLYFVKVIWLSLNVFFVYRIWKILMDWLPINALENNKKIFFTIISFIFALSFLRDNFHFAQFTTFILYLTLEGLFFISKKKILAGSLLIAFGIDVKLLPIVIIPYLIYRKEWKATVLIICFILIFIFLPMIFIGVDYNKLLLSERWNLINPMNQTHILDTSERSFHSLTSLLATLFVKNSGDIHALTLKRNIADISIENLNILINVVRGILVLFTLYFLRSKPFTSSIFKIQKLYEISYLCLIIPLIFPHQQHYAFLFIFPASTYVIFYFIYNYLNKANFKNIKYYKTKKFALIIFISISYLLTNSRLILGEFNDYYDHYKTLTYGVLILMILLTLCQPNNLINAENSEFKKTNK
jgi:hypothetical protein